MFPSNSYLYFFSSSFQIMKHIFSFLTHTGVFFLFPYFFSSYVIILKYHKICHLSCQHLVKLKLKKKKRERKEIVFAFVIFLLKFTKILIKFADVQDPEETEEVGVMAVTEALGLNWWIWSDWIGSMYKSSKRSNAAEYA